MEEKMSSILIHMMLFILVLVMLAYYLDVIIVLSVHLAIQRNSENIEP